MPPRSPRRFCGRGGGARALYEYHVKSVSSSDIGILPALFAGRTRAFPGAGRRPRRGGAGWKPPAASRAAERQLGVQFIYYWRRVMAPGDRAGTGRTKRARSDMAAAATVSGPPTLPTRHIPPLLWLLEPNWRF